MEDMKTSPPVQGFWGHIPTLRRPRQAEGARSQPAARSESSPIALAPQVSQMPVVRAHAEHILPTTLPAEDSGTLHHVSIAAG